MAQNICTILHWQFWSGMLVDKTSASSAMYLLLNLVLPHSCDLCFTLSRLYWLVPCAQMSVERAVEGCQVSFVLLMPSPSPLSKTMPNDKSLAQTHRQVSGQRRKLTHRFSSGDIQKWKSL